MLEVLRPVDHSAACVRFQLVRQGREERKVGAWSKELGEVDGVPFHQQLAILLQPWVGQGSLSF